MNRITIILGVICLTVFSCQKEINKEQLLAKFPILKGGAPKDAFVFCLDTIKTDLEFSSLQEMLCKREAIQKVAYIYLSNYKVYLPIYTINRCGDSHLACHRRMLDFVVNEKREWLIDGELVTDLNQQKIDAAFVNYYSGSLWKGSIKINFNFEMIVDDLERDSLYMSLLSGYKYLIEEEVKKEEKNSVNLYKECPLKVFFGEGIIIEPEQQFPIEETKNASQ